jgi:hypothetical protein
MGFALPSPVPVPVLRCFVPDLEHVSIHFKATLPIIHTHMAMRNDSASLVIRVIPWLPPTQLVRHAGSTSSRCTRKAFVP